MKCDELQYERLGDANKTYPASTLVIRKQFVDAAIAELKAKLEDVQATAYAESVDAGMRERKLKRALWLARAERAVAEQTVDEWSRYKEKHPFGSWREDPFEYWVQAWIYVEKLFRKKAKEYK
jgi:hypothetical protein